MKNNYGYIQESREPRNSPTFSVTLITEGLAFGEGNITSSVENPQILNDMDETIRNSSDILVQIEIDDDGCGDGREVVRVYDLNSEYKRSLNRAKVFGGAVAMTAAILIGLGKAHDKSLQGVYIDSVNTLVRNGINFGAHTDEHAHGNNCGCGAIDRSPEALVAILKYEERIRGVISELGVNLNGLDQVFINFRDFVRNEMAQPQKFSGGEVIDHILSVGKVVKKLGGEHQERRIILNQVRRNTINQKLIRDVTHGRGQVFGIDEWRLEDIASSLFPEQDKLQNQALISELVYTLGIAAVLTKGDLPVYMIQSLNPN